MLFQLGPVQFTVVGFNTHETARDTETSFAVKEVVGGALVREYVGEGDERLSFKGKIFPKRVGGVSDLAKLEAARVAALPQLAVRGDGRVMGWFVIETVSESNTYLAPDGVGQIIEFDVSMARVGAPSGSGVIASIIQALF